MDRQQALFAFRGQHQQLDLTALDEIDRIVLIASGIDVSMARNLDRAAAERLALQHIAQLALELVRLSGLLDRHYSVELIPCRRFWPGNGARVAVVSSQPSCAARCCAR